MIRQVLIWLFCLASLLSGCGPRRYPATLCLADSLCAVCPDSAIRLLSVYADSITDASQAVRMYHRLLCIKARDKAYLPHTSDTVILPVLHYYMTKGDRRLLPEACYYAGRVYSDLGDAPQALDYFGKALESMEGEHEDLELKGVVYSQMGRLFLFQGLHEEALKAFRKGYDINLMSNDSISMVFGLRDIGDVCGMMGRQDSLLHYMERALRLAQHIGRMDLMRDVQSQMAACYIDLKQYDLAEKFLHQALIDIDPPSRSGIYCIAARFYKQTGQKDSAAWYYRQLTDLGTVYAKKEAARELAFMEEGKSSDRKAMDWLRMYEVYADSVEKLNQIEVVKRMEALYNYQLRERENQRLKSDNDYQRRLIVYLSASLLACLILFLLLRRDLKNKAEIRFRQLSLAKMIQEEAYNKSLDYIKKNEESIRRLEQQKAGLEEVVFKSKEQLARLQEIADRNKQQALLAQDKLKAGHQLMFNSDIYKYFKAQSEKTAGRLDVTPALWIQLTKEISADFPGFMEKLTGLYRWSEQEMHICLLLKAGFKNKEIAKLTCKTEMAISVARGRMYYKAFGEKKDPKLWDSVINSL